MKVLLDTNVVLDVLLAREPFVGDGAELIELIERKDIQGYLCATTVTTISYLLEKARDARSALDAIRDLLKICEIAEVNRAVLTSALDSSIDDYEDAVLYEAAVLADIDAIITRNIRDFASSQLPIRLPHEFLAAYHSGGTNG